MVKEFRVSSCSRFYSDEGMAYSTCHANESQNRPIRRGAPCTFSKVHILKVWERVELLQLIYSGWLLIIIIIVNIVNSIGVCPAISLHYQHHCTCVA